MLEMHADSRDAASTRYIVLPFMAAALLVLAALCGLAAPAYAQVGYDRPGGDYSNFQVRSGDPAACAARCDRDSRCRAWSFAFPTTVGPRAVCWLKNSVPQRVENACCVSGVRGAGVIEPRGNGQEFGIDRAGGDYRTFDTPADATGSACEAACKNDNRCRAWTYLRPGYGPASARCHLKSRVTTPRPRPCCISGVVR